MWRPGVSGRSGAPVRTIAPCSLPGAKIVSGASAVRQQRRGDLAREWARRRGGHPAFPVPVCPSPPGRGGGPTSTCNGQGYCQAPSHAKQAPGWHAWPGADHVLITAPLDTATEAGTRPARRRTTTDLDGRATIRASGARGLRRALWA